MILSLSAGLGIVVALVVTVFSPYMLLDPMYNDFYPLMVAWGIVWVDFNVFALVPTLIPFGRGERWVWYTLWMLPLLWLSLFALSPDLRLYLVLAIVTVVGLILPYRRFFPAEEGQARVAVERAPAQRLEQLDAAGGHHFEEGRSGRDHCEGDGDNVGGSHHGPSGGKELPQGARRALPRALERGGAYRNYRTHQLTDVLEATSMPANGCAEL